MQHRRNPSQVPEGFRQKPAPPGRAFDPRGQGEAPERYAASKNIHNLESFELEMRRRRAEGT